MKIYYVERLSQRNGFEVYAESGEEAVNKAMARTDGDVICVYHESGTEDGTPYIFDYEAPDELKKKHGYK